MKRPVLVLGASNQVAAFLLPELLRCGYPVTALSRRPRPAYLPGRQQLQWLQHDLVRQVEAEMSGSLLVSLAPMELLPGVLGRVQGLRRVVVMSSTSLSTKAGSSDGAERALARRLEAGERGAVAACDKHGIAWTILRPTLVYGAGMDANLTRIARLIRRWWMFPLPGPGGGLRQPVHAQDLAAAVVAVLERPQTQGQCYELPGGETVSYREMLERVFYSLGKTPRMPTVPRWLLHGLLPLLRQWSRYGDVTPAMLDRIEQDLVFDPGPARRDFDWNPRPFQPRADTWRTLD